MVSLTKRNSFMLEVQEDPELRPLRAFIFGDRVSESIPGNTTRPKLFDALRFNDARRFQEILADLEPRKLSQDSDWIGDDCVVFLLLLGASRFGAGDALVERILECRGKTTNVQVQRVNHAFEAIRRREFAMEGDFAFIKFVFRTLNDGWTPADADCLQVYKQLTTPGYSEQLDPFLHLLALRAFDLIIGRRAPPEDLGNWNEVLRKLQDEGAKLSLAQFIGLLKHIRIGVILAIITAFSLAFAAGKTWSWWSPLSPNRRRVVPMGLLPVHIHKGADLSTNSWMVPFMTFIERAPLRATNRVIVLFEAQSDPFAHPTAPFKLRGTFRFASEVSAICLLIHQWDGLTSVVPVDVSWTGNELFATVPPAEKGDRLAVMVRGLLEKEPTADTIKSAFSLTAVP